MVRFVIGYFLILEAISLKSMTGTYTSEKLTLIQSISFFMIV